MYNKYQHELCNSKVGNLYVARYLALADGTNW